MSYQQLDAISQSMIKDAHNEGWRYFYERHIAGTLPSKRSPAMELGTALHLALLEPERFERKVLVIPDDVLASNGARSGGKWKEFQAANADRVLLKSDDFSSVAFAAEAARRHPAAGTLLKAQGACESVETWQLEIEGQQVSCKGIIDKVIPGLAIVDVKSTSVVQPRKFRAQAEDLLYDVQATFYREAWRAKTGEELPFVFVAVEMEPPYRVRAYQVPDDWFISGWVIIRDILAQYVSRKAENNWVDECDRDFVLLEKMRWR